MITIDFATIEDFQEYRPFDLHSKYINPELIKSKIKNSEIILAKENSELVGLLRLNYIWSTRPYIEFIFVKQEKRSLGIGKQLLQFLEDYLVNNKYAYLFSSSEEQDIKAIEWHKKNGFIEMGELTDLNLPHDKTSEIFFSKKISDIGRLREYPI
jgi:ribosomal protein S18 acetylase RimI-like enzyme